MMEAWERIKMIMDEQGLNKNSLSRRIGLQNNVTVTKIINDHRNPQTATLEKIADTFIQYNRDWVLYGNEPKMADENTTKLSLLANERNDTSKLLEAVNKLVEQNGKLIEQNSILIQSKERDSKNIERLIGLLSDKDVDASKHII